MKAIKLFSLLTFILLFNLNLGAQEFVKPELEFVCELKVTTSADLVVGQTAHGERRIIPITGGTFESPLLKGIVLEGGADYQYADFEHGRTEIEAIYTIKTDDNVLIHIRNVGLVYIPEELHKNSEMDFSKIYFRATPKFEAPNNSKYDWMNNAIFICNAVPNKGYVSIQVWKVM